MAVKVITGDNGTVAGKVCRDIGLDVEQVRTGAELERLDDDALAAAIGHTTVFARVSPGQKSRILKVARRSGTDVAFLGDGVNDAVALHAADVGISVESATDVAKDAADIVLLDKDLGVLADGVMEGRRIFARQLFPDPAWDDRDLPAARRDRQAPLLRRPGPPPPAAANPAGTPPAARPAARGPLHPPRRLMTHVVDDVGLGPATTGRLQGPRTGVPGVSTASMAASVRTAPPAAWACEPGCEAVGPGAGGAGGGELAPRWPLSARRACSRSARPIRPKASRRYLHFRRSVLH